MTEVEIGKLLMTGGPGVVALMLIFRLVLREMPENRRTQEQMVKQFVEANELQRAEFLTEMRTERAQNAEERKQDRASQHHLANAVQSLASVVGVARETQTTAALFQTSSLTKTTNGQQREL